MNSEALQGVADGVHHSVVPPDADVHDLPYRVRDEVDIDVFIKGHIGHLNAIAEQGDASVAIDESRRSQAKHILGRGVGLGQEEGTEQVALGPSGFLGSNAGDLFGRGMGLMVVVAMHLLFQDGANLFHGGDLLQDKSARSDPAASGRAAPPCPWPGGTGHG